jgi:hypothetical protein
MENVVLYAQYKLVFDAHSPVFQVIFKLTPFFTYFPL